ncbi:hypothetical protein COCMIDRAFT_110746, partial [Bipolaris oryzae ATCC 44560]
WRLTASQTARPTEGLMSCRPSPFPRSDAMAIHCSVWCGHGHARRHYRCRASHDPMWNGQTGPAHEGVVPSHSTLPIQSIARPLSAQARRVCAGNVWAVGPLFAAAHFDLAGHVVHTHASRLSAWPAFLCPCCPCCP